MAGQDRGRHPVASDHSELRWLGADELDSVRWMPADLPFVEALRPSLPRGAR
ncbi:NUDIX hydrolase [Fodinicola feengrottensis]|uniref:hypothetical protein n=1 Tax=Fodinicola feengrottensis TaxID=435914 RepID=UPI002442E60C|nr:hypothetical protein [Fodinicola feengrottensis]